MSCDPYLEQAKNNEQAARSIERDYPDWAVTMCFYAALHWVEYYACVNGHNIRKEHPASSPHESRWNYVFKLAKQLGNRNLLKVYENLENESKKSRYLKDIITNAKALNAKAYYTKEKLRVTQSFQNLQQIRQLLEDELKKSPKGDGNE